MLQPASFALKFGFLAVLYIFLLWVAWSVLRDVRRSGRGLEEVEAEGRPLAGSDVTSMYAAASLGDDDGAPSGDPRLMVERAPGHEPGMAYALADWSRWGGARSRFTWRIRLPPLTTPGSGGRDTCWS